jgi:hypothetical protein
MWIHVSPLSHVCHSSELIEDASEQVGDCTIQIFNDHLHYLSDIKESQLRSPLLFKRKTVAPRYDSITLYFHCFLITYMS